MHQSRRLSCVSLDSGSGMTWSLPLAKSSAWSLWKVSADLVGTVFPVWEEEASLRDGTENLDYAWTSVQTRIWKAQSGVRGKFRDTGQLYGGPGSGKQEGRMEMVVKRWSPRANRMPSLGGCGQGRASQGTLFANPKRVSFLTQWVKLRLLENVKGRAGMADQWPTFECHFPCGTRGRESRWGLKARGWAGMRRGRDSEAGHMLLGWARVKAWSCGGSCREPWQVALSWVTGAAVLGFEAGPGCWEPCCVRDPSVPPQRNWRTPRAGFCFAGVLQVMSQI